MNQYKKRYAIIHADDNSYIIGGYLFDPINKLRKSPENDFLQSITTLPNTIVSFSLAIG
jgi:hypothetical protein